MTLDRDLAAKCTGVPGVLCDFHLLDLFSKRSTVSGIEMGEHLDSQVLIRCARCVPSGGRDRLRNHYDRIPSTILAGHTDLCKSISNIN